MPSLPAISSLSAAVQQFEKDNPSADKTSEIGLTKDNRIVTKEIVSQENRRKYLAGKHDQREYFKDCQSRLVECLKGNLGANKPANLQSVKKCIEEYVSTQNLSAAPQQRTTQSSDFADSPTENGGPPADSEQLQEYEARTSGATVFNLNLNESEDSEEEFLSSQEESRSNDFKTCVEYQDTAPYPGPQANYTIEPERPRFEIFPDDSVGESPNGSSAVALRESDTKQGIKNKVYQLLREEYGINTDEVPMLSFFLGTLIDASDIKAINENERVKVLAEMFRHYPSLDPESSMLSTFLHSLPQESVADGVINSSSVLAASTAQASAPSIPPDIIEASKKAAEQRLEKSRVRNEQAAEMARQKGFALIETRENGSCFYEALVRCTDAEPSTVNPQALDQRIASWREKNHDLAGEFMTFAHGDAEKRKVISGQIKTEKQEFFQELLNINKFGGGVLLQSVTEKYREGAYKKSGNYAEDEDLLFSAFQLQRPIIVMQKDRAEFQMVNSNGTITIGEGSAPANALCLMLDEQHYMGMRKSEAAERQQVSRRSYEKPEYKDYDVSNQSRHSVKSVRKIKQVIESEWKGDTSMAQKMRDGYNEIAQKHPDHAVLNIRGDNYCAIRAPLVGVLATGGKMPGLEKAINDEDLKAVVENLDENTIKNWRFQERAGIQRKQPVTSEVVFDYMMQCINSLKTLEQRMKAEIPEGKPLANAVAEYLNTHEQEDLMAMEAIKALMLLNAHFVYTAENAFGEFGSSVAMMRCKENATTFNDFVKNYFHPMGHGGGLEMTEIHLLAVTLGCGLPAFSVHDHGKSDFLRTFGQEAKQQGGIPLAPSSPLFTLLTEDDRHYNVLLHQQDE